ncbi:hypothetical protein ACWEXK_06525 [Staphylococcus xylosus]|uniref:hypothetical protein n=1 Tax=Staphylococcus xylosus TaxID=1288 RepID=UPI003F562135
MNTTTFERLLNDYASLNNPRETTAIKYNGTFNDVQIHIYFDAWDDNNYNFQLIIHDNLDYYLTTLNIMENSFTSKYLAGISSNLLKSISIDHSLEDFYLKLEDIIENNKCIFINYNKDSIYTNTSKYNPPSDKMYLKTLSHKNMTDEMFEWARYNTNIDLDTLNSIRRGNLTFVRTPNINKRKRLRVIFETSNINL